MYICLCNAITDRDIYCAVRNGTTTLLDLREQLGCCSQCGQCVGEVRQVWDQAIAEMLDKNVST